VVCVGESRVHVDVAHLFLLINVFVVTVTIGW
jgi:hypothetical protein